MQSATSLCHCNSIACDSLHNPKPVGFQSSELENIHWKERSHSANSFWIQKPSFQLLILACFSSTIFIIFFDDCVLSIQKIGSFTTDLRSALSTCLFDFKLVIAVALLMQSHLDVRESIRQGTNTEEIGLKNGSFCSLTSRAESRIVLSY